VHDNSFLVVIFFRIQGRHQWKMDKQIKKTCENRYCVVNRGSTSWQCHRMVRISKPRGHTLPFYF
jgi:hypothetical protein